MINNNLSQEALTMAERMLNSRAIQRIANSSDSARIIFEALRERGRDKENQNIYNLRRDLAREGKPITTDQIKAVFKELERLKLGKFKPEETGKSPIFVWHVSSRLVGETGLSAELQAEVAEVTGRLVDKPSASGLAAQILANRELDADQKVSMLKQLFKLN